MSWGEFWAGVGFAVLCAAGLLAGFHYNIHWMKLLAVLMGLFSGYSFYAAFKNISFRSSTSVDKALVQETRAASSTGTGTTPSLSSDSPLAGADFDKLAPAQENMAIQAAEEGKYSDGFTLLTSLISRAPASRKERVAAWAANMAHDLYMTGQYKEALELFDTADRIKPGVSSLLASSASVRLMARMQFSDVPPAESDDRIASDMIAEALSVLRRFTGS